MTSKDLERILLSHRFNYIRHQQKLGKKPNENTLKEYQRVLNFINNEINNIDYEKAHQWVSSLGINLNEEVQLINYNQNNKLPFLAPPTHTFLAQHTHPLIVLGYDKEKKGFYLLKFTSSNNKAIAFYHILYENVKLGELVPLINKENFCKASNITMERFVEIYEPKNVKLIRDNRTIDWGENGNTIYYNAETLVDENGKISKISQVIYFVPNELLNKYSNKFKYPLENIENILKDAEKFIFDLPNLINLEVYNFGTSQYEKFDINAIQFSDREKTHQAIIDQFASTNLTIEEVLMSSYQVEEDKMSKSSLEDLIESNSRPVNSLNTLNKDGNLIVGRKRDDGDWF